MESRSSYVARIAGQSLRENLLTGADRRRRYLRSLARHPLESASAELIAKLPGVELADLADLDSVEPVAVRSVWAGRGNWSLGPTERLALQVLIKGRAMETVFEIGTYNGGTTRVLAETLGDDGKVVTLDLDPAEFNRTQSPADLKGDQVGSVWRESTAKHKVTQLLGDSSNFDFTAYRRQFDLVLVDGAHDYEHGLCDTRTALGLVRPGGLIVFDDFTAYWVGLVRGIVEAAGGQQLSRLNGTDLGVIRA